MAASKARCQEAKGILNQNQGNILLCFKSRCIHVFFLYFTDRIPELTTWLNIKVLKKILIIGQFADKAHDQHQFQHDNLEMQLFAILNTWLQQIKKAHTTMVNIDQCYRAYISWSNQEMGQGVRVHTVSHYPKHHASLFIAHQRNTAAGHTCVPEQQSYYNSSSRGNVPHVQSNATHTARYLTSSLMTFNKAHCTDLLFF